VIPDANFTLDKAKAHLRVTHADEDALITSMLDSAVAAIEATTRRALTNRTWSTDVDACDLCGCDSWTFHALLSPAVGEVFAINRADGSEVQIDAANVIVRSKFGHTVLHVTAWPTTPEAIGIVGRIDWASDPGGAPANDLYAAVMLTLGDLYENREAQVMGIVTAPNPAVHKLVQPHIVDMHV